MEISEVLAKILIMTFSCGAIVSLVLVFFWFVEERQRKTQEKIMKSNLAERYYELKDEKEELRKQNEYLQSRVETWKEAAEMMNIQVSRLKQDLVDEYTK